MMLTVFVNEGTSNIFAALFKNKTVIFLGFVSEFVEPFSDRPYDETVVAELKEI